MKSASFKGLLVFSLLIFALITNFVIIHFSNYNIVNKVYESNDSSCFIPDRKIIQHPETNKEKIKKQEEIYGDWVITTEVRYYWKDIVVYGNITIKDGGKLVLCSSTLKMAYNKPIVVESGGNLTLISSTITDYNTNDDLYYWIVVKNGGFIKMIDSTISYGGYLVQSVGNIKLYALNITGGTFEIRGSTFENNYYGLLINQISSGSIIDTSFMNGIDGEALIIKSSQNILIKDCEIYNNPGNGIIIEDSSNIVLDNLKVLNNTIGIYVTSSTSITIKNSVIANNSNEGIFIYNSNFLISNVKASSNSKDIYIFSSNGRMEYLDIDTKSLIGIHITQSTSSIELYSVSIEQNNKNGYGIVLDSSSSVTLDTGNIIGGYVGVRIVSSSSITLRGLRVSQASTGVSIEYSNTINLEDIGSMYSSSDALKVISSNSIHVSDSVFAYSASGIYIDSSSNIELTRNIFFKNTYGVYLTSSVSGALIYMNDFLNNTNQAFDDGSNSFDNGTIGNYWSDDPDSTIYYVDDNSIDYHPKHETLDQTPPTISIVSPTQDSFFNTEKVLFEWTASDDFGIREFKYSINGGNPISLGYKFRENITLPDGYVTVTIYAVDWSGNTAASSVSIYVEAPPKITILWPKNQSYINYFPFTAKVYVHDNTMVSKIEIYSNDIKLNEYPVNIKEGSFDIRNIIVPDGLIFLKMVCYDTHNNAASSFVKITVSAPPKVSIITPAPNSYFNSTSVNITWTAEDNSGIIDRTEIWVNGQRRTIVPGNTTSVVLPFSEGKYDIMLKVFDSAGNYRLALVENIVIDVTPPSITILCPENGTVIRNSTVVFSWSVYDDNGIEEVSYHLDDMPEVNAKIADSYSVVYYNLTDGIHYLYIKTKDKIGNSKLYKIKVNVQEPPRVFIIYPANNTTIYDCEVELKWKAYDNVGIKKFIIHFFTYSKTILVDEDEQNKIWSLKLSELTGNYLDDGNYTVYIEAVDVNYIYKTYVVYFKVISAPWFTKIGVFHPIYSDMEEVYVSINNTYISLSDIKFRVMYTDNDFLPIALWVRLDNREWKLVQNTTVYEAYITFENVSEGLHYFWFKISDTKGNTRTEVVILTVDFTPPSISVNNRVIYTNSGNFTIEWNAFDNAELFRFEVYINGTVFRFLPNGTHYLNLALSQGVWEIEIRAVDVAGNSASDKVLVYVDKTPPKIKIVYPQAWDTVPIGFVEISWNVSDNVDIDRIEIYLDFTLIAIVNGNITSYKVYLNRGSHNLLIKVYDKAGNLSYDYVSFAASESSVFTTSNVVLATTIIVLSLGFLGLSIPPRKKKRMITNEQTKIEEESI